MKPLTQSNELNNFMQAVIVTDAQRKGARVSNEDDQIEIRERSGVSDCCKDEVGTYGLHTYCVRCGEPCHVIYHETV